ncbi:hypothetical protein BH10BAC5_BH10BAC5_24460 [soil metagenome]
MLCILNTLYLSDILTLTDYPFLFALILWFILHIFYYFHMKNPEFTLIFNNKHKNGAKNGK